MRPAALIERLAFEAIVRDRRVRKQPASGIGRQPGCTTVGAAESVRLAYPHWCMLSNPCRMLLLAIAPSAAVDAGLFLLTCHQSFP